MTIDPPVTEHESREVADLMLMVSRFFLGSTVRALTVLPDQLSLAQFRALVTLYRFGPLTLTKLAGELGVQPSSAVRMMERLEGRGLAVSGASSTDRRASSLLLTHQGRRVVEAVLEHRAQYVGQVLDKIAPERQPAVISALRELTDASGEYLGPLPAL